MKVVQGLRQCHHEQIVAVAVVTLGAHVVVELVEQAGRGLTHFHQHVSVRGTRPARPVVLKEDVIGTHAGHARQHAAIDGVDVIAANGRELGLNAQAEGVVVFLVGARGGDPVHRVAG
ncbi:hypothetical protein D3C84_569620 [compost metagenome]